MMGTASVNAVLITAKGNNTSIPDKNLIVLNGRTLIEYPIMAAKEARHVGVIYVSTNCPRIAEVAREAGCLVIDRPAELCTSESQHGDTIVHGVRHIRSMYPGLRHVTVLLGNSVAVSGRLIDLSIRLLDSQPTLDSAMSVWQAQDDHPYRALTLSDAGYLTSGMSGAVGTSRQAYPPVFYYDQGVWTFRHEVAERKEGPHPWWWMGRNVFPIVRRWVTGRDVHTQLDVDLAAWWLQTSRADIIENMASIEALLRG